MSQLARDDSPASVRTGEIPPYPVQKPYYLAGKGRYGITTPPQDAPQQRQAESFFVDLGAQAVRPSLLPAQPAQKHVDQDTISEASYISFKRPFSRSHAPSPSTQYSRNGEGSTPRPAFEPPCLERRRCLSMLREEPGTPPKKRVVDSAADLDDLDTFRVPSPSLSEKSAGTNVTVTQDRFNRISAVRPPSQQSGSQNTIVLPPSTNAGQIHKKTYASIIADSDDEDKGIRIKGAATSFTEPPPPQKTAKEAKNLAPKASAPKRSLVERITYVGDADDEQERKPTKSKKSKVAPKKVTPKQGTHKERPGLKHYNLRTQPKA